MDAKTRVECLALETIERIEHEGEYALARACLEHPAEADKLRRLVGNLLRTGLLDQGADGVAIPGYEILRRLGAGGMGQVFLARDSLDRLVALKLLQPGLLGSPRSRARFEREVRTLAELDHPGICTVFEARTDAEPPYLAMRYVPGGSLAEQLDERRRSIDSGHGSLTGEETDRAIELTAKLARALHAAHELGIIHRDVKPANVMLDAAGDPVLVDFGLSRREGDATPTLTMSGAVLGTPAYMAPEQIEVGVLPIGRHTDVYALGMLLYEALTLELPFRPGSREALFQQILAGVRRDPRSKNRHVRPELVVVLEKAIARDPRDRFETALELADELTRVVRRESILSRRPNVGLRVRRWSERNPLAAAALALVSIAFLTTTFLLAQNRTLAATSAETERERRAQALADASRGHANDDPTLALQLVREALELSSDRAVLEQAQAALLLPRERARIDTGIPRDLVLYSPDGSLLAVPGSRGKPAMLFARDGSKIADLPTEGNSGPLAIDFHPSSEWVVVGSSSGAWVFDRRGQATRKLVANWKPDPTVRNRTGLLSFSPDGSRLAAGSYGQIGVWDFQTGFLLERTAAPHSGWTRRLVFAPDGRRFVSIGQGGIMTPKSEGKTHRFGIWTRDGELIRSVDASGLPLTSINANASRIVVTGRDGSVRFFDWHGTLVQETRHPGDQSGFIDVTQDGSRFVTTTASGLIRTFLGDGQPDQKWQFPTRYTVAKFTHDDRYIVSCGFWGELQLWSLAGWEMQRFEGHGSSVRDVAAAPGGESIASVSFDATLRIWDLEGQRSSLRSAHEREYALVRVEGDTLISRGRWDDRLSQWSLNGQRTRDRTHESRFAWRTYVSATGKRAAFVDAPAISGRSRVHVLDSRGIESMASFDVPGRTITAVPTEWDDGVLFVDTEPKSPVIRWMSTSDPSRVEDRHALQREWGLGLILGLQASPDGEYVAVGGGSGRVALFGAQQAEPLWISGGHILFVTCLAFERNNTTIWSGSFDGTVRRWDIQSGECLEVYRGHRGPIFSLHLSRDSTRMLTASGDSTARLWDVTTGETVLLLRGHKHALTEAWFIDDDRRVVTSCVDGSMGWWFIHPADIRSAIDRLEGVPELSAAQKRSPELRRYFPDTK